MMQTLKWPWNSKSKHIDIYFYNLLYCVHKKCHITCSSLIDSSFISSSVIIFFISLRGVVWVSLSERWSVRSIGVMWLQLVSGHWTQMSDRWILTTHLKNTENTSVVSCSVLRSICGKKSQSNKFHLWCDADSVK